MFCRLTYSCIQFIQRMLPPLSVNYKTKPNWLSLLCEKGGQMSTVRIKLYIVCYRIPFITTKQRITNFI